MTTFEQNIAIRLAKGVVRATIEVADGCNDVLSYSAWNLIRHRSLPGGSYVCFGPSWIKPVLAGVHVYTILILLCYKL